MGKSCEFTVPDMARTKRVAEIVTTAASLKRAGQLPNALAHYQDALSLSPRDPQIFFAIGQLCIRLGRLDDGIASYCRAVELRRDYPEALNNLANAFVQAGDHERAEELYRRALNVRSNYAVAHSNMLLSMHYQAGMNPQSLFAQHQQWAAQQTGGLRGDQAPYMNDRSAVRPLRIGYLSAGFHSHPVAVFFESIISAHNRENAVTFCYSNVQHPDAATLRIQGLADYWRDVRDRSDDDVAKLIRQDHIDILVDLTGHTRGSRLLVFARRPAPVQVTYLGYPNTTGLSAVDYRLSDSTADPPGMTEAYHAERLVRLPRGFLCYRPPPDAPIIHEPPAIQTGTFTFGCFNDRAKITSALARVWSRILSVFPKSRLLLHFQSPAYSTTNPNSRRKVLELFRSHGVCEDRLLLIGSVPRHTQHLALYSKVDLALDPFPYCGTTTTCEALWMGVPVVTLAGNCHVARVGASLLRGLDLAAFVSTSEDDYVERAVKIAADVQKLRSLRLELRSSLEKSSLLNAAAFTSSLESAYREMWRRWIYDGASQTAGLDGAL